MIGLRRYRGALAIGWLAVLVAGAPPAPPVPPIRPEENPAADILKIEPAEIELGEIHRGEKFTREVTLTNVSDSPVSIVRAFATCGCAVPEIPEEPIQPGESVVLNIEYLAQNPGETDTTVQFFLEEMEGSVSLHVRAMVLHPIVVDPASFDPLFQEDLALTLTSTDGSEFEIYAVEPDVAKPYQKTPAVKQEVVIDAAKAAELRKPFNTIRFYVDHKRTSIVFLRSSKIETTTQTQRIINWARGSGEADALEGLITDGAEVDRPDANGRTPLMYAAQAGQVERIFLLMEHGADVNAMRADGETALMAGAKSPEGTVATLEALAESGADINARDQFGRTALFWCARSGDLARLQWLLDAGADINVRGPFNETELIAAVKSRSLEKVRALVDAGADLRAADANGRDAAFHARAALAYSRGPQLEVVREIIRYIEERTGQTSP